MVVRSSPIGVSVEGGREAFSRRHVGDRSFWISTSESCAEFIARIAKEKFGFEDASLAELIEWAHIIDGAFYESPAQCVELRSSALKLMQVIEGEKDPKFIEQIIRELTERSLDEIVASDEIQAKFRADPRTALENGRDDQGAMRYTSVE